MKGFALFGMLAFVFFVGKYGLMPVFTKIGGVAGAAKADFLALEARVWGLEQMVVSHVPIGVPIVPVPQGVVNPTPAAPSYQVTTPAIKIGG
jgi:hypothetical protein